MLKIKLYDILIESFKYYLKKKNAFNQNVSYYALLKCKLWHLL